MKKCRRVSLWPSPVRRRGQKDRRGIDLWSGWVGTQRYETMAATAQEAREQVELAARHLAEDLEP